MNTVETATNSNEWLVTEDFRPERLLEVTSRILWLNRHVHGCSITAEPDMFPQYGRYFSAYSVREKIKTDGQPERDTITTVREEEYEYFDKVWYKTPKELDRACWVDPFDDFNENTLYTTERIASYCKPLRLGDGRMVGVISTDLALNDLAATIDSVSQPYPNAWFMLIGNDGHYFIHPDPTVLYKKTIFSYTDPRENADQIALGHDMTAGHEGQMRVVFDGSPCLVSYRPVPGTTWSLALVCPERDILGGYHQLVYIIIGLIVVGLTVILLLCRRAVAHAMRPVGKLLSQIRLIADGQYEVFIPHTSREDAVGQLQNSFAQVLPESQALPKEEMASIKNMMLHNSNTLTRLVQMLFDSSDLGLSEELNSHKYELVSCNQVARESILYTQAHVPDITVNFETDAADDFCICTNALYLMRSLRELLYNSAKYSDGQHLSCCITHTDSTVKFCVEDIGPGISEEKIEQMFKPFAKIDDLTEGLGLGLPLAKHHAQSLGGDLTLDTSYTQGCRFVIELPVNINGKNN